MDADLDIADLELRLPPWTRELLACLTARRRQAFVLRDATKLTFDEVGARLDVSPSCARQLYEAAVRVMTAAAHRAALLAEHAPVVVSHMRPMHDDQRCAFPPEMRRALELPIEALGLGVRGANCLHNAGVKTVGELVVKSESEILKIMKIGRAHV